MEISNIQAKKADLHKKLADKEGKLLKAKQDLAKEEEKERKKVAAEEVKTKKKIADDEARERKKLEDLERKRQRDEIAHQRRLQEEIRRTKNLDQYYPEDERGYERQQGNIVEEYDIFISHASEDKEDFVRPLAETLENMGLKVWYDEFTLRIGDSLSKSINQGLVNSRFGLVIISPSFCSKDWPQYELEGMISQEMNGKKMILPIWHKVSKDEVIKFNPTLADKLALNTAINTIEEIARQLAEVVSEKT